MAPDPKLDEKLRNRYGQDRFNPSAGQTQMSYQEWLDRHPGMTESAGSKNRYDEAMTRGAEYQAKHPDWATQVVEAPKAMLKAKLTKLGAVILPNPSGGPDAPPSASKTALTDAARRRAKKSISSDFKKSKKSKKGEPPKAPESGASFK